jgi:SOUL heme-binding protein
MKLLKIFCASLLLGLLCTGHVMAIEEPKYEVIQTDGAFEMRKYAPILIAETMVDGDMDEASNKGFRLIADYIFGNNQVVDSNANTKIAMTAPVTVEPQSTDTNMQLAKKWRIHFVMPSQYTLANIPKPKNDAITLKEIPSKYFLVYSYSWLNTLTRVQNKTDEALEWANRKGLKVIGVPKLSRYDPPWTLPMFKRNEIMLEVAAP